MSHSPQKKFAIVGNCQAPSLKNFLITNDQFNRDFSCIGSYYVPGLKSDQIEEIYLNVLNQLDLIIIQPISENYGKMSTKIILNHIKAECIVILFPSCYFSFYHPYTKSIVNGQYKDLINPSYVPSKTWEYHEQLNNHVPFHPV